MIIFLGVGLLPGLASLAAPSKVSGIWQLGTARLGPTADTAR
jgi:hypothetical protein